MKKIFSVVLISFIFSICLTAQNAVTYMPLINSVQFQNRIVYQMVLAAPVIETETVAPNTPACHSLRAQLASQVMRYPMSLVQTFTIAIVTSSQVTTAGALTGTLPLTLDTPATDAALFSAVNAAWNSIAGCITN